MQVEVHGNALRVVPGGRHLGTSLSLFLEDGLRLPQGFIRRSFAEGNIRSGKRPAVPDQVLHSGDIIWLNGGIWPEQPTHVRQEAEPAAVLFEDDHLMVVVKPAGILVHSDGTSSAGETLDNRVLAYRTVTGQPALAWHVHRLDMGTSGVVLYAKHAWMARALDGLLGNREISRHYLAAVIAEPKQPTGVITGLIGRDRHVAGRYRVSETGKPAITHYQVQSVVQMGQGHVALLACWLETGRTHQIRVHLADMGCPIIGDALYGGGEGAGSIRLQIGYALHAQRLSFIHPYTGEEIAVTAKLPATWAPLSRIFGESLSAPGGLDPEQ